MRTLVVDFRVLDYFMEILNFQISRQIQIIAYW